jgi:hypothetical protein
MFQSDMTFMSPKYNKVKVLPSKEHQLKGNYIMVKSFTLNGVLTWSFQLQLIWSKSATNDIFVLWGEFDKTPRSKTIERIRDHKRSPNSEELEDLFIL